MVKTKRAASISFWTENIMAKFSDEFSWWRINLFGNEA
jgi:hypothetical protein